MGHSLGGLAVIPELAQPPILRHQSHLRRLRFRFSDKRPVLLRQELFEDRQGFQAQLRRVVVDVVNDVVLGVGMVLPGAPPFVD